MFTLKTQNKSKIGRSEWALLIPFFLILCIGLQFFSNFHKYQNADSLMFSIMSYTKVTLFYWGQDRMLSMM
jgi:glucan phosphoethanolaminetransferase (alkaline phosphatase superfamily)